MSVVGELIDPAVVASELTGHCQTLLLVYLSVLEMIVQQIVNTVDPGIQLIEFVAELDAYIDKAFDGVSG